MQTPHSTKLSPPKRLQQLVSGMGGESTSDEWGLPSSSYLQAMLEMIRNTMTRKELELKGVEEELIWKTQRSYVIL
jgi:hypothetical protein